MDNSRFLRNFTDNIEGIDVAAITLDTPLTHIPQWDSMAILTTLAMVDTEYGVQISGVEVQRAKLVRDLMNAVAAKLSK